MRYPSTTQITEWFKNAGFVECFSRVGHHIILDESARNYLDREVLTKDSTSQLSLLGDQEYNEGMEKLRRAVLAAEDRDEDLRLRADLRIHATFGTVLG